MKRSTLFLLLSTLPLFLWAQPLPKKYVLLEHFTNSRCSICASRNPAFYTLINQYPDDVHHLSVHPSVPYNNCLIYLANPAQNNARTAVYGISGTPRVALNGTLVPVGSPLLPATTLENALGQTSPVYIKVQESGTAPTKNVTITVFAYDEVSAGNYKLFAAVSESTVNYNSPNGESKHHDVFRAMLPNINGENITLPAAGDSLVFNYSYTFTEPNGWTSNFDSLYVLAFIQNTTNFEVLNSGTRFDPPFTFVSTKSPSEVQAIAIRPNPVAEEALISLPGDEAESVTVFSLDGRLALQAVAQPAEWVRIPAGQLSPGIYVVRITGKKGIYVGKMVKE